MSWLLGDFSCGGHCQDSAITSFKQVASTGFNYGLLIPDSGLLLGVIFSLPMPNRTGFIVYFSMAVHRIVVLHDQTDSIAFRLGVAYNDQGQPEVCKDVDELGACGYRICRVLPRAM